jgi:Rrf2 family protein
MMRINRRTDYAIRVVLTLAKLPFQERLSTQEIQKAVMAPRPFLQRIIADLSRAGLIHTYPGPKGGIQLAHLPEKLNLRHIWEAIEGPLLISDCIEHAEDCALNPGCPVTSHWAHLQQIMLQELESVSFLQLAEEADELSSRERFSRGVVPQGVSI